MAIKSDYNTATARMNQFNTMDPTLANQFSGQHIIANYASYEAARSGFFTFSIDFGTSGLAAAAYASSSDAEVSSWSDFAANASQFLELNVTKAFVPDFSVEVHEFNRGNEKVKFAGVPSWESGSIEVDDVVGLGTKDILLAWKGLAYNTKTRKGGRMASYKFPGTLTEYTQDFVPIRSWKLDGCFISKLDEDDFDKSSDGPRKITATIEYDRAVPYEGITTNGLYVSPTAANS